MTTYPMGAFLDAWHDPRDLVSVLAMKALRRLEEAGLELRVHDDFERLAAENAARRDRGWYKIMPMFDPEFHAFRGFRHAFWFEGRAAGDRLAFVQAARCDAVAHLDRHIESLRVFYEAPSTAKHPEETCEVTARMAGRLSGRLCYGGGFWIDPDFRTRKLSTSVPRLSRWVALRLFEFDHLYSFVRPFVIEKQVLKRYGYRAAEPWVRWRGNQVQGPMDLYLIAMDADQLLADADRVTGLTPAVRA